MPKRKSTRQRIWGRFTPSGEAVELGQVAHVVGHQSLGARKDRFAPLPLYQADDAVAHEGLEHHQGVPQSADAGTCRCAPGPLRRASGGRRGAPRLRPAHGDAAPDGAACQFGDGLQQAPLANLRHLHDVQVPVLPRHADQPAGEHPRHEADAVGTRAQRRVGIGLPQGPEKAPMRREAASALGRCRIGGAAPPPDRPAGRLACARLGERAQADADVRRVGDAVDLERGEGPARRLQGPAHDGQGHRVVGATERLETHELERRVREDQPGEPLEAGRPLPRARTLPEPFAGASSAVGESTAKPRPARMPSMPCMTAGSTW